MRRDKIKKPISKLEKVLHFDRNYKRSDVSSVLGITPQEYDAIIRTPWKNVRLEMLAVFAVLLEMDVIEVFWLCYRENVLAVEDVRRIEGMLIVDRLGLQ